MLKTRSMRQALLCVFVATPIRNFHFKVLRSFVTVKNFFASKTKNAEILSYFKAFWQDAEDFLVPKPNCAMASHHMMSRLSSFDIIARRRFL